MLGGRGSAMQGIRARKPASKNRSYWSDDSESSGSIPVAFLSGERGIPAAAADEFDEGGSFMSAEQRLYYQRARQRQMQTPPRNAQRTRREGQPAHEDANVQVEECEETSYHDDENEEVYQDSELEEDEEDDAEEAAAVEGEEEQEEEAEGGESDLHELQPGAASHRSRDGLRTSVRLGAAEQEVARPPIWIGIVLLLFSLCWGIFLWYKLITSSQLIQDAYKWLLKYGFAICSLLITTFLPAFRIRRAPLSKYSFGCGVFLLGRSSRELML